MIPGPEGAAAIGIMLPLFRSREFDLFHRGYELHQHRNCSEPRHTPSQQYQAILYRLIKRRMRLTGCICHYARDKPSLTQFWLLAPLVAPALVPKCGFFSAGAFVRAAKIEGIMP
jgi:hypothetical protein